MLWKIYFRQPLENRTIIILLSCYILKYAYILRMCLRALQKSLLRILKSWFMCPYLIYIHSDVFWRFISFHEESHIFLQMNDGEQGQKLVKTLSCSFTLMIFLYQKKKPNSVQEIRSWYPDQATQNFPRLMTTRFDRLLTTTDEITLGSVL